MPDGQEFIEKMLRDLVANVGDLRQEVGELKGTWKATVIILGLVVPTVTFLIGKMI